jgi:hypothetical protein
MKLTGIYVWTACVEVEVPDNATNDEQRMALDDAAMDVELDFKNPVLHSCSNEDLVD